MSNLKEADDLISCSRFSACISVARLAPHPVPIPSTDRLQYHARKRSLLGMGEGLSSLARLCMYAYVSIIASCRPSLAWPDPRRQPVMATRVWQVPTRETRAHAVYAVLVPRSNPSFPALH